MFNLKDPQIKRTATATATASLKLSNLTLVKDKRQTINHLKINVKKIAILTFIVCLFVLLVVAASLKSL